MQHFPISDELWTRLAPVLPEYKPSSKGGRPRLDLKKVLEGILFVKGNRLQWRETPKEYGAKTTLNDYFRQWKKDGVFKRISQEKIFVTHELPQLHAIDLDDDLESGSEQ